MAGNFNDKREKADWTDESDEFDLDAELAGLSSFLEEMGVQLEDEGIGDDVTGDVSFDFSDEAGSLDMDVSGLLKFTDEESELRKEPDSIDEPELTSGSDTAYGPELASESGTAYGPELASESGTAYEPELASESGTAYEPEPVYEPGRADGSDPAADAVSEDEFDLTDDLHLTGGFHQTEKTGLEEGQATMIGIEFPDDSDSADESDPKEKTYPAVDDHAENEEREKRRRAEKEVDKVLRKTFGQPFSWKREVLSWVAMFAIAFALAFIIDNYLIVNATVPTGSMQNTIMAGDRMIGWRLSYLFSDPERGDIIIFKYPDNPEEIYVKRVIGLPGETVTITNGEIYINDSTEPLEEDYLPEEWVWKNDGYTFVVPEDSYLCLGDNRNNSHDARSWTNTYVTKDAILGQAVLCYWPTDDFGWLN